MLKNIISPTVCSQLHCVYCYDTITIKKERYQSLKLKAMDYGNVRVYIEGHGAIREHINAF